MLSPAEALRLVLEQMSPAPREDCPLAAAAGRVLRMEIRADRDLPPFDRVTLDGYALRSSALADGIRRFNVARVQAAGMVPFPLGPAPDVAIEVMTGAVLPEDADCVVPYEQTKRAGAVVEIVPEAAATPAGGAVHRRGSDHRTGDLLLAPGLRLGGKEIAIAASCGHPWLTVSRQPRVAILATGDELVDVASAAAPHQVRRSNDYALAAALGLRGYPRVERHHVRDLRSEVEHRLWHLLAEYDALVIVGGVSQGRFDFVPTELDRQGVRKVFQGVAQRPGKPFWFGVSPRGIPVFALPGNPVSAYTCLHRYVLPALDHAAGLVPAAPRTLRLAAGVTFRPPLAWLLPVRVAPGPDGAPVAWPEPANTSGDLAGLAGTDGFLELPAAETEFPAGYTAPFFPW